MVSHLSHELINHQDHEPAAMLHPCFQTAIPLKFARVPLQDLVLYTESSELFPSPKSSWMKLHCKRQMQRFLPSNIKHSSVISHDPSNHLATSRVPVSFSILAHPVQRARCPQGVITASCTKRKANINQFVSAGVSRTLFGNVPQITKNTCDCFDCLCPWEFAVQKHRGNVYKTTLFPLQTVSGNHMAKWVKAWHCNEPPPALQGRLKIKHTKYSLILFTPQQKPKLKNAEGTRVSCATPPRWY